MSLSNLRQAFALIVLSILLLGVGFPVILYHLLEIPGQVFASLVLYSLISVTAAYALMHRLRIKPLQDGIDLVLEHIDGDEEQQKK